MAFARIAPGCWILAIASAVTPVYAQTSQTAADNRSESYFNFSMGHLYAEMAGSYGNRGEYVNKAIDYYKQALKLDPASTVIAEELADFYLQAGQVERATEIANGLVKADPSSVNGHKLLARIYSRQAGDPEQGRVDQNMLKQALAEYQQVVKLDPKDSESLSMLARMYRVTRDEVNAEKTYRQILAGDPNDSDALTGLAALFADRGDLTNAIKMLKRGRRCAGGDPRTVVTLAEFGGQCIASTTKLPTPGRPPSHSPTEMCAFAALGQATSIWPGASTKPLALTKISRLRTPRPRNLNFALPISTSASTITPTLTPPWTGPKQLPMVSEVRYAEAQLLDAEGKTADAITLLEGLLKETCKNAYNDLGSETRAPRSSRFAGPHAKNPESHQESDAIATFRQIPDLNLPSPPALPLKSSMFTRTPKTSKPRVRRPIPHRRNSPASAL